jgi:tight adherence protein B
MVQTDEFNFLIVAVSIQRDTGGNLAETLANLSALLRARQQLRLKIRAFTSEARATMIIMAGLPFLVGGGLFLVSPNYIGALFTTESGQMVAAAAAASMGFGIFVMNKIATIKV